MTDHYESVLHHLARPEKNRTEHTRVRLTDFEALYVREQAIEYAAYTAPDEEHEQVALGLAEYLDDVIRDEGKNFVYVYPHTRMAKQVCHDSVSLSSDTTHMELQQHIADKFADITIQNDD